MEIECITAWEIESNLHRLGDVHLAVAAAWGEQAGRKYTDRVGKDQHRFDSLAKPL